MSLGPDPGETAWRGEDTRTRALSRPALVRIGVVALLLGLTVGWFNLFPRYERSGDELLRNGQFDRQLEEWSVHGPADAISVTSGSAILENRNPKRSVRISQAFPLRPEYRILGLEVDVSTEGLESGAGTWLKARVGAKVHLVGRSPEGKLLWYPHLQAAQLTGDSAWLRYTGALVPPKEASEAVVTAALVRATGVMRVRNLSVFPVRELAAFRIGAYILLAGWVVTALFIAPTVFRGLRSTTARAVIAVVPLAILVGALIPYPLKRAIIGSMENGLRAGQSLLPALPLPIDQSLKETFSHLDGLAHGLSFFAVALFVRVFRSDGQAVVQFGLLLLFAAVTETLQYFTLSRSPSFSDWLWDVGGISLAFLLSWCFGLARRAREV